MAIHNVLDFNIIGDGNTDNTDNLNKLMSILEYGETLYFPSGKYLISDTIYLKKGINILGESWQSVLIRQEDFVNKPMIICNNSSALPNEASFVSTLTLDGKFNDTPQNGGHGIYVENTQNFFIKNVCIINQGGSGIKMGGSNLNNTIEINDSYIRHNAMHGVYVDSYASDIHIYHCDIGSNIRDNVIFRGTSSTIKNSVLWGSKSECGLRMYGKSNHISECQIEGNARHAVLLVGASHCSIRSNKIYASVWKGAYGIYIEKTGTEPVENIFIQGNMIYSSLVEGYSPFTRAIHIQSEHKNIKVYNNNVSYLGIGTEDFEKRPYVTGLSMDKGDTWNNIDAPLFLRANMSLDTILKHNTHTPLLFDDVLTDISEIVKDGYIVLREDGIYTLSGTIRLLKVNNSNQTRLSLLINGKVDETIYYYQENTPKTIEFSKTVKLNSDSRITLNMVTVGEDFTVSKSSTITFFKH